MKHPSSHRSNSKRYWMTTSVLLALFGVCSNSPTSMAESGASIELQSDGEATYLLEDGERRYTVVEGDILVPIEQGTGSKAFNDDLWDDGIIRYEIERVPDPSDQALLFQAFAIMESIANVRFVEGIGILDNGINIYSTNPSDCSDCDCVNNATVGETFFGSMNICNWNLRVLLHELAHVMNLWHEQSRGDRNSYVYIHLENVEDGQEHNFEIHDQGSDGSYGPYDFKSLMHYREDAFSSNGLPTITVLPPNQAYQGLIGTYTDLSHFDKITLSFLYPRDDWRFVDASSGSGGTGSFLNPFGYLHTAVVGTPPGGVLWVQPGDYLGYAYVIEQQMTLRAPLGGVVIKSTFP